MEKQPTYKNIHNRFKLNGTHYRFEDLFEVAYSFIKEGEEHERAIGDFLMDWIRPNPTITLKTSGSTGTPKLITYKKQAMVNSALATGNHFGVNIGDRALHCLSADFIAGKMMLVRAMILGLELDLLPPQGNALAHNATHYDFAAMVPLQVEQAFGELNRIKILLIGGAPSSNQLKARLKDKTTHCFETYGMTETLTHIASRRINGSTSAFSTLPQVKLGTDERGCLIIKVPYLFDQAIITNDLVELQDDQSFILKGRIDNVINSGGFKLIPEEIEQKLSQFLTFPFFLAGVADDNLGQKLVLIAEGEVPAGCLESVEIKAALGKYEQPKAIYTLTAFSRTPNGKIQRAQSLAQLDL